MLLDKKELDENELDKSELRRKCSRRNVTEPSNMILDAQYENGANFKTSENRIFFFTISFTQSILRIMRLYLKASPI